MNKCCKINYKNGERGQIFLDQGMMILLIRQFVIPWKLFICARSTLQIFFWTQTIIFCHWWQKTNPLHTQKKYVNSIELMYIMSFLRNQENFTAQSLFNNMSMQRSKKKTPSRVWAILPSHGWKLILMKITGWKLKSRDHSLQKH